MALHNTENDSDTNYTPSSSSSSSSPMATCHVVAMPYPGRGHINPMMNLCNILASRRNNILVTFVVTEEWLGLIGSETKPPNIRFATIPNVLPSELVRAANMESFFEGIMTKMEEPFQGILDRLDPPPNVIVADCFLLWAVDVGNRRNIPVASFWPMPATVFSFFYHFDLLVKNGHFPVQLPERAQEEIDYIPGLSPFRLSDLPTLFYSVNPAHLQIILQLISKIPQAQYLLFNTVFELESPVIEALQPKFSFPIYSLGPLIPYFNLDHNSPQTTIPTDDKHYLTWLDSQSQCSVLYVSLGSFLSVSSAQMDEIAAGLRNSGVKYLWVARDKTSGLKETVCGGAGMIVPWCDQLKVLCHSSVGGFWTHCGWNSTTEGVFAGVPFLAFPIVMDQVPTSKLVEEDWKIGWRVKRGNDDLVRREEIADLVRKFMDSKNVEREQMVGRGRELRDMCRRATEKGGSSETNIEAFIEDISK